MKGLVGEIYQALLKMFVKDRKRFPMGNEQQQIVDEAESILNDALTHNLKINKTKDEGEVMLMISNKDPNSIINDAMAERSDMSRQLTSDETKQQAEIIELPLKDSKKKEAALKKKLEAQNLQSKLNLEKSASKQQAKVAADKKTMQELADNNQIPVIKDGVIIDSNLEQSLKNIGKPVKEELFSFADERKRLENLIRELQTPMLRDDAIQALKILDYVESVGGDKAMYTDLKMRKYKNMPSKSSYRSNPEEAELKADKEMKKAEKEIDLLTDFDPDDRTNNAEGGIQRVQFSAGASKALLDKIKRQMQSPFGKMAIKESSGALPKGVEEGSPIGDILEGVNQIESLLGETKSLPVSRMEIADFVMNMRKDGFSNEAIRDIVENYGSTYRLKTLRERIAPQIKLADRAGAKTNAQRKFVVELEDTKDNYTPYEFRDYIEEKDYIFDLQDAIKEDLIKKGLSDDAASDISSYLRGGSENIFGDFDAMKANAYRDYDTDIDDIINGYESIVEQYVLPQKKQYKEKFNTGGLAYLQGL
tara:strand:- start:983 stop:2587 length:1605 start_codon:yes stop_codon:yes gene_type:complete